MVRRDRCPGCRGLEFELLFRRPYAELPVAADTLALVPEFSSELYELRRCRECGLTWQPLAPDDDEAVRLYGGPARPGWAEWPQSLDFYVSAAREVAVIAAALGGPTGRLRFLDFGMGQGDWARLAAAFGVEVYGVELTEEARAEAQRLGIVALAPDELDDAGEFDFIHTEQVFEHLAESLATAAQLRARLRPRGLLKISVPEVRGLERSLRRGDWQRAKSVLPIYHVNAFRRSSLVTMAALAGLEETRVPFRAYYRLGEVTPGRPLLKALVRPVYRNVLRRGNYVFFRRAA